MNWYMIIALIAAALFWVYLVGEGLSNQAPAGFVMGYCLTLGLVTAAFVGLVWPLALLIVIGKVLL